MDDTNQPVGQWIQKICMGVFTIASLLYLLYAGFQFGVWLKP